MNQRILVVDDEKTTATLIKYRLEREGYIVDTAGDGREALELIKQFTYDLIISDVEMPNMDGVDLYTDLKKSVYTSKIPIIIMTSDEIFKNAFQKLGVEGFIPKPIMAELALKKVEKILGRSKEADKKIKIVLLGENAEAVERIQDLLRKNGCYVKICKDGKDCIAKSLEVVPNIVIIDIMCRGISSLEIVKTLHCLSIFRDCHFVTYSYFAPEQMGDTSNSDRLKEIQEQHKNENLAKYIGRFDAASFLDSLREFGV